MAKQCHSCMDVGISFAGHLLAKVNLNPTPILDRWDYRELFIKWIVGSYRKVMIIKEQY